MNLLINRETDKLLFGGIYRELVFKQGVSKSKTARGFFLSVS